MWGVRLVFRERHTHTETKTEVGWFNERQKKKNTLYTAVTW